MRLRSDPRPDIQCRPIGDGYGRVEAIAIRHAPAGHIRGLAARPDPKLERHGLANVGQHTDLGEHLGRDRLVEFDQSEFVPDGKTAVNGLHDTGLVYVPGACAEGETCSLHVVLHGCEQSTEVLGDTFYKKIGVNEWADANGIVVLYPQARSVDRATLDAAFPRRRFQNSFAVNPHGCWNWWGYGYDERFALKDGVQIGAIHGMIKRVMGSDAE